MKVILARVTGDPGDAPVLDAAYAVAHKLKSHIKVMHMAPDPRASIPLMGESASASLIQDLYDQAERELAAAKERARDRFADWRQRHEIPLATVPGRHNDASVAWTERLGDDYSIIGQAGRLADLIVIMRPKSSRDLPAMLGVEAAIFGSGRPTLLVPPESHFSPSTKALVAWDGSREATRALSLAVPLLRFASTVEIMSVAEADKHGVEAEAAEEYLAWHDIKAAVARCEPHGSIAETVLAAARQRNAGMLVMGAYTHTRIREMVLGGVTRHVLNHAEIPAFVCH
jgi:nucleotide-binding universal stress UspA family protein